MIIMGQIKKNLLKCKDFLQIFKLMQLRCLLGSQQIKIGLHRLLLLQYFFNCLHFQSASDLRRVRSNTDSNSVRGLNPWSHGRITAHNLESKQNITLFSTVTRGISFASLGRIVNLFMHPFTT